MERECEREMEGMKGIGALSSLHNRICSAAKKSRGYEIPPLLIKFAAVQSTTEESDGRAVVVS